MSALSTEKQVFHEALHLIQTEIGPLLFAHIIKHNIVVCICIEIFTCKTQNKKQTTEQGFCSGRHCLCPSLASAQKLQTAEYLQLKQMLLDSFYKRVGYFCWSHDSILGNGCS